MAVFQQPSSGNWNNGFFSCCDSCTDCMCAYFCGPCYACHASSKVGQNIFCQIVQCCFFPQCLCCLRAEARNKKGIEGNCFGDCLLSCFCPCCTVIQIKKEFD